jgi:hypothetical protein
MGRNSELIRQWTLLRQLAAVRTNTIPKLAQDLDVTTRTVRRDLAALQIAGFPIYDDTVNGTKFWRMDAKAMGALARSGLTIAELSALYFSRALLECFAGTPLLQDLQGALDKFEAVLSPAMKKFLDRLPRVLSAKAPHAKRQDRETYQTTAKLLEASVAQRVVSMRYHSQESRREKDYVVHPYRLVHAQRPVPDRLRAGLFGGSHIRRRTGAARDAAGGDIRAGGRARFRPVQEFARRPSRPCHEGTTPVSPPDRDLDQGAHVARVAAVQGPRRRLRDHDPRGL